MIQVHGVARDDLVDGDARVPDRGRQEERRHVVEGVQDDQDEGANHRVVQELHLGICGDSCELSST